MFVYYIINKLNADVVVFNPVPALHLINIFIEHEIKNKEAYVKHTILCKRWPLDIPLFN